MAEDAALGLPNLPLEDALQLVHLYAEGKETPMIRVHDKGHILR